MNKFYTLSLTLAFFALSLVANAQDAPESRYGSSSSSSSSSSWSEKEIQEMYLKFLSEQGIEGAFVDSDGDVQFKYNDRGYFMEVNEGDPEFFRVVLFNIWPIESTTEHVQATSACNEVTRSLKCVKAYVTNNDNVWIAVELFVGEVDAFKPVFMRSLKTIDDAVDKFVENM